MTNDGPVPTADMLTLTDGTAVPVRPIRPTDVVALQAFFHRLSPRSVYLRFFAPIPVLTDALAQHFANVDGVSRVGLVALDPADVETIIAHIRYEGAPGSDFAELAMAVADGWQGRGVGSALSHRLIAIARRQGMRQLFAEVHPENGRMLRLFRHLGLPEAARWNEGTVRVEINLGADDETIVPEGDA